MDEQQFYYSSWRGRLIGSKAREHLIAKEFESIRWGEFFLEVGCAQGHFEKKVSALTQNVFGAEISREKISQAVVACPLGFFAVANAESLPFKSNSFDFVLCTEVLEHIPNWKKALLELQRVARKKILITIPLEHGLFWRAFSVFAPMGTRGHLHRLGSREIAASLDRGWRVAKKSIIATPSRKLNRLLGKVAPENLSIFCLLLLEKN